MAQKYQPFFHLSTMLLALLYLTCLPSFSMEDSIKGPEMSPRVCVSDKSWTSYLADGNFLPDNFPSAPRMTHDILNNILKSTFLNKSINQSIMIYGSFLYIYQSYDLSTSTQLTDTTLYMFLDTVLNSKHSNTTFWSYLAYDPAVNTKYSFILSLHHWPSLKKLPQQNIDLIKNRMVLHMMDTRDACEKYDSTNLSRFSLHSQKSCVENEPITKPFHLLDSQKSKEKVSEILSALSKGLPPHHHLIQDRASPKQTTQEPTIFNLKPSKHPQATHLDFNKLQAPSFESTAISLSPPSSKPHSPRSLSTSPRTPQLSPRSSPHQKSKRSSRTTSPRTPEVVESPRQSSPRVVLTNHAGAGCYMDERKPNTQKKISDSKLSEDGEITVTIRVPRRMEKILSERHALIIKVSLTPQQDDGKNKVKETPDEIKDQIQSILISPIDPYDTISDYLYGEDYLQEKQEKDLMKNHLAPPIELAPLKKTKKTRSTRRHSMPPLSPRTDSRSLSPLRKSSGGGIRISLPYKGFSAETS